MTLASTGDRSSVFCQKVVRSNGQCYNVTVIQSSVVADWLDFYFFSFPLVFSLSVDMSELNVGSSFVMPLCHWSDNFLH
jgi:hypothetical protein